MIIDQIQNTKKRGLDGQVTMFDLQSKEEEESQDIKYTFIEHDEFSERDLLATEKEMLGIYLSGHPLEKLRKQIEKYTNINTMQIRQTEELQEEQKVQDRPQFIDGQFVKYAGIINQVKKKYTKSNKLMAFVSIEDLYGITEVIVFENAYMQAGNSLLENNIVMVEGRLSIREDEETKIVANKIYTFGVNKQKKLILDISGATEEEKSKLRGAIKYFSGEKNNMPVFIKIIDDFKSCGAIYYMNGILNVFEDILGRENVEIKEE